MKKGSKANLAKKGLPTKKTTKKARAKFGGLGITANKASAPNRQIQWRNQSVDTVTVALEELEIISGEQSGDSQGLSNVECASSESVDELLEEGNAFEAEVVKGVEDAEDADGAEVRTHAPRVARASARLDERDNESKSSVDPAVQRLGCFQ